MNAEQIREIVKITLDELAERKQAQFDNYDHIKQVVEKELRAFFRKNKSGTRVGAVLRQLSDDEYIDVIFLNYRDGKSLEWIAECMKRDVSTIKRNKKRLIIKIYDLME